MDSWFSAVNRCSLPLDLNKRSIINQKKKRPIILSRKKYLKKNNPTIENKSPTITQSKVQIKLPVVVNEILGRVNYILH